MTRRTSKRKTSHRTKPVRRGTAARRTSRRVRANTIPPPPTQLAPHGRHDWLSDDFENWVRRTYAPGTRVVFNEAMRGEDNDTDEEVTVPAGAYGVVRGFWPVDQANMRVTWKVGTAAIRVYVDMDEPLFTSTRRRKIHVAILAVNAPRVLRPLDDNWGPLVVAPKRHSPPPTSGWQKQLSASRRMRARKVQPNENEHRIGPPPCVYLDAGRFRSIDAAIDKVQSIRSDGYRAFIVVQPSRSQPGAVTYAVVRPTKQCEDYPFIRDSLW